MKKFNPFRPNSIVRPGMFVGRLEELEAIEDALLQTRFENPQNFLVLGERGIGKSSLLLYVDAVASGNISLPDDTRYNFLTASIDLGGCQSQLEIIQKIGRGIREAFDDREQVKRSAKDLWDWISNWEVLGIRYHRSDNLPDCDLIISDLVTQLAKYFAESTDADGLLLLIDEADRPPVEASLGETLKVFAERLQRRGCDRVLIGMAGLPSVVAKLRQSHDSSPRLFQTMNLQPLDIDERERVIEMGLSQANDKNTASTKIDPAALKMIADLSEGYPHFIQQFAFCSFDCDKDGVISVEDVGIGTYREGGALDQLGDKYFNEMYHARISSDEYRSVLDAMARYGDDWVSRKTIIEESGAASTNVDNALKSLKSKEVIIHDESQRGRYRLPTKSFAAWINATQAKNQIPIPGRE